MKDLKRTLYQECHGRNLAERKRWYSRSADAYQQARPRYPQALIDRVVEIAQLSAESRLLEVGCGPAIATPAFADLGCRMHCLEPNPDFYRLAQPTLAAYPQVTLENRAFEEWPLQAGAFDAVLAASSFHWIPPEVGYAKAAAALRPEGYLILLWNKELQPSYEVYQQLAPVYAAIAPTITRTYEDPTSQAAILQQLGDMALESGHFQDIVSGEFIGEVTYSIDRYLLLLNTYSPFFRLSHEERQRLFAGLRQVLEQSGNTIQLTHVSMFHVACPKPAT